MGKYLIIASILLILPLSVSADEQLKKTDLELDKVKKFLSEYKETKSPIAIDEAYKANAWALIQLKQWFWKHKAKPLDVLTYEMLRKRGAYAGMSPIEREEDAKPINDMRLGEICRNFKEIADFYVETSQIEKAKKIYRNIIADFNEEKFRGCVKRAEFGLEDIKSLEKEMQK